jgi:uncharacterized lipoprotein YddW (UPF0748 family)
MILVSCGSVPHAPVAEPPDVAREFRGAWIATVANIDWPSRRGMSSEEQQQELIAILDKLVDLNMNAAIFQVRPAADALYASEIEPWSEYLSDQMGLAPEPFYDPLAFAVEQAHSRGIELHAWFNPFRARHSSARTPASNDHVSIRRPDIVRTYGTHLWLDPGMPEAREYSLSVIMDVVRRYAIDGVHIDDYFYPYKERDTEGQVIDFPDEESYRRAVAEGETRERDDWRRHNVDRFVRDLYTAIKQERPEVRFGISPFGVWRPGYPPGIRGFDAYQEIYADARLWLREGWLDYFTPQLYWPIHQTEVSYPVLLDWWIGENVHGRHMWPGNFTSRVSSGTGANNWPAAEILEQIRLTRARAGAEGNVHFSMRALMENRLGLADSLRDGLYARPALVPASPWLGGADPVRPVAMRRGEELSLGAVGTERPWLWVVQYRTGDVWHESIMPGARESTEVVAGASDVHVSSVNRLGRISRAVQVE